MPSPVATPVVPLRRAKTGVIGEWEEALEHEHARTHVIPASDGFRARVDASSTEGFHIARMCATPVRTRRTVHDIATDMDERVALIYVKAGTVTLDQGEQQTRITSGQALIYNLALPASFEWSAPFRNLVVAVRTEDLRARGITSDDLTHGLRVNADLGAPWLSFMRGLWSSVSQEHTMPWPALLPSVVDGFGMMISTSPDLTARNNAESQRLYAHAWAVIEAECHDPDLTPETIATQLHISRRTLFRLFAEHGTSVGAAVLKTRLERAAQVLRLRGTQVTVEYVAHLSGFRSTSTFHSRFHAHFGASPRQYALEPTQDQRAVSVAS